MLKSEQKYLQLQKNIAALGSIAVGFSGGVDSSFLLWVAHDVLGERAVALTARSAVHPQRETEESMALAQKWGVRQIVVDSQEMKRQGFIENPQDRCYQCKKELFTQFVDIAEKEGFAHVADGSNADDRTDYRPGRRAVLEVGIISPLEQAGLTKAEIRELSKRLGLETWDKSAFACLASRIPYGEEITDEKLQQIENAEEYLLTNGFKQVRVRHHGNIARIEVAPEERVRFFDVEMMDRIAETLKDEGFEYITLDLQGYRMGSLNGDWQRDKQNND